MTLGAWRRAARRARAKVWVSLPTSRWLMVDLLCGCRYSIGSSMVMMWKALSLVDLVDDGGEGRGLAGAGGAGDEHDAVALVGDLVELGRDAELLDRRHAVGDDAQDDRIGPALREHVDAEARALGQAVREVGGARLDQLVREVALARQQAHRDELGVVRQQPLEPGVGDRLQLPVELDLGRTADREVEVGDARGVVEHRLEQRVEFEIGHCASEEGDHTVSFLPRGGAVLEDVDLDRSLSKAEYQRVFPDLQERLRRLQYALLEAEIPTVVVFEGWDASGKGTIIQRLTERLDPRAFRVHPGAPPSELEQRYHFLLAPSAPAPRGRPHGPVRPLLVRPRPGGPGGEVGQAQGLVARPTRRSTSSSAGSPTTARSWSSSGSTSRRRSSAAA